MNITLLGIHSAVDRKVNLGYSFNNKVWGVRKVTTGITGLWQPSDHSDVAF